MRRGVLVYIREDNSGKILKKTFFRVVGTDIGYCGKTEKNIWKILFWLNEEIYSMEVCIGVFVWKLDTAFICYIDPYINQRRSKDITNWSWPGYTIFALSKTALNSRETLLHILRKHKWLLFATYHPPNQKDDYFFNHLETAIDVYHQT